MRNDFNQFTAHVCTEADGHALVLAQPALIEVLHTFLVLAIWKDVNAPCLNADNDSLYCYLLCADAMVLILNATHRSLC